MGNPDLGTGMDLATSVEGQEMMRLVKKQSGFTLIESKLAGYADGRARAHGR